MRSLGAKVTTDVRPRIKVIYQNKKITSRALMNFMGVNGHVKCSLSIKKIREQSILELEKRRKRKLIRVFQQIVLKAAHAFVPNEAEELIHESMKDFVSADAKKRRIAEGTWCLWKR